MFEQKCEINESNPTDQCGWQEDMKLTESGGKFTGKASRALDFEGYELKIGSTYSIMSVYMTVNTDEQVVPTPSVGIADIDLIEASSAV